MLEVKRLKKTNPIVLLLFFVWTPGLLHAQTSEPLLNYDSDMLKRFTRLHSSWDSSKSSVPSLLILNPSKERKTSSESLMFKSQMAFFCRLEWKLDQKINTGFRFRLGSVDYVNYLEGKLIGTSY